MKTIILAKSKYKTNTQSEVFINSYLLEVGQFLFNLYDNTEIIYKVAEINKTVIGLDVFLNQILIEKKYISFDLFSKEYHWYFMDSSNFSYERK